MENNQNIEQEQFKQDLKNKYIELKECQKKNNIDSCSKCELFFSCDLRKTYVDSVYKSMNKDSDGGFDF